MTFKMEDVQVDSGYKDEYGEWMRLTHKPTKTSLMFSSQSFITRATKQRLTGILKAMVKENDTSTPN